MKRPAHPETESQWHRLRHAAAAGALMLAAFVAAAPVMAQDFERRDMSDEIADSEISVEDTKAAERTDELLQTMAGLRESIDRVKVITNMDRIDVIYLSDLIGENRPDTIENAIEENEGAIGDLQNALQGSAIFYNALDSRRVNLPDVVSIAINEDEATIYVRGVAPDSSAASQTGEEDGDTTAQ